MDNTLMLTWKMEGGAEGEDSDPNNPLSRELNRLFNEGKPFIRLMQCFCADRRRKIYRPILRWLGVFILSAGGRIIFFPGFQSSKQYLESYHGRVQKWSEDFEVDHISLENDFRQWHITSSGLKPQRRRGLKTTELGQQRFLWYGLSVSSLDELRMVSHKTKVIADVPRSDAKRRSKVFLKSRERARFQLLEWHNHVWERGLEGFWHFGLIICSPESPLYKGGTLGFPEGSPFLASPLPEGLIQMPVRHHRLDLSTEIGLQITTAVVPGSLRVPVSLTAP